MHHELIEKILHARLDPLFTMLGLEESRNLPRIPCLVVASFRETYRERLDRRSEACAMNATTALLSIPPDKNAPSGTSLII